MFGWHLSGGRLLAMTTPSMCPTVCVGSLVAVVPQVGRPSRGVRHIPSAGSERPRSPTVSSRCEDNGSFTTKGDAEASPDPWLVSPSDILGRVSFTVSGVGWWCRALPMVAAGTLVLFLTRRAYRLRNRRTFERMFGVLIVAVPLLVSAPARPWRADRERGGSAPQRVVQGPVRQHGAAAESTSRWSGVTLLRRWRRPSRRGSTAPRRGSGAFGVRQLAALPTWGWVLVGGPRAFTPSSATSSTGPTRPVELESAGVARGRRHGPGAVRGTDGRRRLRADAHGGRSRGRGRGRDRSGTAHPCAEEVGDPVAVPRTRSIALVGPPPPTARPWAGTSTTSWSRRTTQRTIDGVTKGPSRHATRRALGQSSAPRRSGGHRPRPVPEPAQASRHQSRRREQLERALARLT